MFLLKTVILACTFSDNQFLKSDFIRLLADGDEEETEQDEEVAGEFDKDITNNSDKDNFDIQMVYTSKDDDPKKKYLFDLTFTCKNDLDDREVDYNVNYVKRHLKRNIDRARKNDNNSNIGKIEATTVSKCELLVKLEGKKFLDGLQKDIIKDFKAEIVDKKEPKKEGSSSSIPDGMDELMDNMIDVTINIVSDGAVNKKDIKDSSMILNKMLDGVKESDDLEKIQKDLEPDEDLVIDTIASTDKDPEMLKKIKDSLNLSDKGLKVQTTAGFDATENITESQLADIIGDVETNVEAVLANHTDGEHIDAELHLYREWKRWGTAEEEDPESEDPNDPENPEDGNPSDPQTPDSSTVKPDSVWLSNSITFNSSAFFITLLN